MQEKNNKKIRMEVWVKDFEISEVYCQNGGGCMIRGDFDIDDLVNQIMATKPKIIFEKLIDRIILTNEEQEPLPK